jgi:4-amino-4-deoxy-L-arabinose transferase-like glycosyltransferase
MEAINLRNDTLSPHHGNGLLRATGRALPWLLFMAVFFWLLATRMQQPGDLYDSDQPKTMAYTVDMIRHGRWAVPRDTLGDPATKPPMYNWLSLPAVLLLKTYQPWAFKLPSIIAAAATCGLIAFAARRMAEGRFVPGLPALSIARPTYVGIGALAAAIFVTNFSVMKLMYFSRPDMVQTAFLTGAWVTATVALAREGRPTLLPAAGFWLCITGAALTKGPAAAIPLVYAVFAARLVVGKWSALHRLHPLWSLPLFLLPLAIWAYFGLKQMGGDFVRVLGAQVMARLWEGGPEGQNPVPWKYMPVWFYKNFQPWSILAVAAILAMPVRACFRQVLTPAVLWGVLVMAFFSIPGGKRADYLLPIYPPAAIMAAFVLISAGSAIGLTATRATVGVLVLAWFYVSYPERRSVISSDGVETFVRVIQPIVNDEAMVVIGLGRYHPMLPLMGRIDGTIPASSSLTKEELEQYRREIQAAQWVVLPMNLNQKWSPRRTGTEIALGNSSRTRRIGIFHVGGPRSPTPADLEKIMYLQDAPAPATSPPAATRPDMPAQF